MRKLITLILIAVSFTVFGQVADSSTFLILGGPADRTYQNDTVVVETISNTSGGAGYRMVSGTDTNYIFATGDTLVFNADTFRFEGYIDFPTPLSIDSLTSNYINYPATPRVPTSAGVTNTGSIYRDTSNVVAVDRCLPWTCNDSLDVILTDTTANVGIGTSTPSAALHVVNSAIIDSAGYVLRVGTRVPSFGFSAGAGAAKDVDDTTEYFNGVFYENDLLSDFVGWMAINDNSNYLAYSRFSRSYGTEINGGDLSFSITNLSSLNYIDGNQADGYVLTSDASGDATWQDNTAWGEMGFGDSTSTQALTQNVWHVVTNGNEDLWASAVVDTHAVTYSNDSLIIGKAGTYSVHSQLSVDGSTSSIIRLGIYINGALACTCTGYQELTNNTVVQVNYINIDQLNEGDVLQVVITNTANNDDVDAIGGKLAIHKID